ncbi:hypothetical protein [Microcoleus sp. N9_A1]|uniref:hypothetical protein n=1 Tax=Microcoleus sp. N9_A1 TaxID=3055380 RepID=UPI002FD0AA82
MAIALSGSPKDFIYGGSRLMLKLLQKIMMGVNNTSQNTDRQIGKATIEITKNTVQFDSDVYQFRNVTGFGVCPVPTAKVPSSWIWFSFIFGILINTNFPQNSDNRTGGMLMIGFAILSWAFNKLWPPKYGLKLYLNSGSPLPIFITRDVPGLKNVVSILYNFMESHEEGRYIVYSTDRSIKIEGSVRGNFIGGDATGDVSNKR